MKIAIAVSVLDRPKHLRLCLSHIKEGAQATGMPVFVFQDMPLTPPDRHWRATYDVARDTPWVAHVVRPKNIGYRNIIQAVSDLMNEFDAVILIQDDVAVSADAIEFFRDALTRYENAPSVFSVCCGQLNIPALDAYPRRALFARFFDPQASAFWRRSWQGFDPDRTDCEWVPADPQKLADFNVLGGTYFSDLLANAMRQGECLWDLLWYSHMFRHQGYSLFPKRSLVFNTGALGGSHMDHMIRIRGRLWEKILLKLGARRTLYHSITATPGKVTRGHLAEYRERLLGADAGAWPSAADADSDHRFFCATLDEYGYRFKGAGPGVQDSIAVRATGTS